MAQLQMILWQAERKYTPSICYYLEKKSLKRKGITVSALGATSSGVLQMVLRTMAASGTSLLTHCLERCLSAFTSCGFWLVCFVCFFPWARERFDHSNKTRTGPALKEIRKIGGQEVDLPTASARFCVVLPLAWDVGLGNDLSDQKHSGLLSENKE